MHGLVVLIFLQDRDNKTACFFFSDDVLIVSLVFSFHYICVTAYVDSAALV